MKIEGIPIRILLNNKLNRNLIKLEFIYKYRLAIKGCVLYALMNFDNSIIGIVDSYTKILNLRIGYRYKKISLNLILRGVNNITLGILWLKEANPLIE